jgi:O-antigen/teichoic acid export membrane protein
MTTDASKEKTIRERVIVGMLANSAGQFVTLAIGFFLTPFILHQLGASDFGLWALVGSVVAYTSLLDFGIWGALVKYIAEFRARGETGQAGKLIATGLQLYTVLGLIAVGVSILIASIFPQLFSLPQEQWTKATWMVILSGAAIGVSIPCSMPSAILRGLQRYDLVNLLNITGTVLYASFTVLVLLNGGGVLGMMAANIVLSLVMQVPGIYLVHRVAPEMKYGWGGAERNLVRKLASFSVSLFVQDVAYRVETKTDEIVIGAFMPISAVTPFAIARRLSELAGLLTEQFIKVFLPIASELDAENDRTRLRALYITGTRLALAIFLPIGLTLVLFASGLLTAWVGAEYAQYAPLVWILTLAGFIGISQWPAGSVLQGIARHRPLAIMSGLSALLNLVLSIVMVRPLGLVGVALGTLIPTAAVSLGLVLPYAMRVMEITFRQLLRQIILPALLPAIPATLIIYLLQRMFDISSLIPIALAAAAGALVYLTGYLTFGASDFERDSVRRIASRTIAQARLVLKHDS